MGFFTPEINYRSLAIMKKYGSIALFYVQPTSVTSLGIALGTLCLFTHCAVEVDGVWYDASESRGDFGRIDLDRNINRRCVIIRRVALPTNFLELLKGMRYDFSGVAKWLPQRLYCSLCNFLSGRFGQFSSEIVTDENPYCFEVGHLAITGGWNSSPVSGCDIRNLAENKLLSIHYGRFGDIE